MTHAAKILADSVSPDGVRLTTLEVTFPRCVLAEFNTHRTFSRNSASSRAIPVEKMIRMVQEHPYVPTHWGKNQKGMQAEVEIVDERDEAIGTWLEARDHAVECAIGLAQLGVHKQITNRLLEPFMWHTVICSATEWSNWDHLRANRMAHPEIKLAAELMLDARQKSEPHGLDYGEWHCPLIQEIEWNQCSEDKRFGIQDWDKIKKISVGRCARVSYLTHDGKRDPDEDVKLCDRLLASGHMSPFEHVARPAMKRDCPPYNGSPKEDAIDEFLGDDLITCTPPNKTFFGNFRGWVQMRKEIPNEHDILGAL